MTRVLLFVLLALLDPARSGAQQSAADIQREALAGLGGVFVVVEPQGSRQALEGITAATLEADIAAKLRRGQVHVYTGEELKGAPGAPFLLLRVGMVRRTGGGTYVYNVGLQLHQLVSLARKPQASLYGMTWQSGGAIGLAGPTDRVAQVRKAVGEQVDQFVGSYRAANTRGSR